MRNDFEAVSVWAGGWQQMSGDDRRSTGLRLLRETGERFAVEGSAALRNRGGIEREAETCDDGFDGRLLERLDRLIDARLTERLGTDSGSPLPEQKGGERWIQYPALPESEERERSSEPVPEPAKPTEPERRVLLAECLDWLQTQRDWAPDTLNQYRGLVGDWSAWWAHKGEPEPDVRELADGFFVPFAEWRGWKGRTARKQASNFRTLLRSQMSSAVVSYGRAPELAVLSYVPADGLPKKRRERRPDVAFDRQIQTARLDAADCSALIRASESQSWPACNSQRITAATVWAGVWSLAWLYGIRERDLVSIDVRNFDRETWTLTYLETKTGKLVGPLPIPGWLRPLVALLIADATQSGRTWLFPFPRSMRNLKPSNKAFYRHCGEVYAAAGVKPLLRKHGDGWVNDWIHGWRRSCILAWKRHAPGYQRFITAHKLVADVSDDHYAAGRVLDDLREFVETYPRPSAIEELNQRLGWFESACGGGMEAGAVNDGTARKSDCDSETGSGGEDQRTGDGACGDGQARAAAAAD